MATNNITAADEKATNNTTAVDDMVTVNDTVAIDMATGEKTFPASRVATFSSQASAAAPVRDDPVFVAEPMFHTRTRHAIELGDYFRGPRDIDRHSKWPQFMRMHGSILPKMIIPLVFVGAWATTITTISLLVQPIGVNSVVLTVLGFVVALALSFRSTTAYERFSEGRKYWSQLLLNSRNLARMIWIHTEERYAESEELGKQDLLGKLAALQLINAFAVSLKHRLRFEPSTDYPDLAPLVGNLHVFAADADQAMLHEKHMSRVKSLGQYLGVPMAESNPRKLIKRSKENLGNTPLEVLTYLSSYMDHVYKNKTLGLPVHQQQSMNFMFNLNQVLSETERVVNTPLPVAYSISIAQITWTYVVALPFQLVNYLGWVAIPATMVAGYIILGLAQIGRELENPFGQDVNDLPLDTYCNELANDIDAMTAIPAPLDADFWMRQAGSKPLWPLSDMEFMGWESRSVDCIRTALRAKAASRDVKRDRMVPCVASGGLSNGGV